MLEFIVLPHPSLYPLFLLRCAIINSESDFGWSLGKIIFSSIWIFLFSETFQVAVKVLSLHLLNSYIALFDKYLYLHICCSKYICISFLLNILSLFYQHCSQRSARTVQKLEMSSRGKLFLERQSWMRKHQILNCIFQILSHKIEIPTLLLQNWGAGKVLSWSEYVRDKQQKLPQGEQNDEAPLGKWIGHLFFASNLIFWTPSGTGFYVLR